MKKFLALIGVMTGAFTLSGCELNNQEMESIISKCKEDTECKAILDREIDEALADRGIFGSDYYEGYDVFYDLDLTEEEQVLLEALEALDNELWDKLDAMTDEELDALEVKEFESMLGRALTEQEQAALTLVDTLYETAYELEDYETEQEYLAFYLGRELTTEEITALEIVEAIYEQDIDENGSIELTPEQEAALDIVDELYNQAFEMSEIQELELLLGRQLTTEELAAFTIIDNINYEEVDGTADQSITLTPEEEAAFDLIDALYEEAYTNYEVKELEMLLSRELTTEEQAALETVNNLYIEMEDNFIEDDDYDYAKEMITYYETVLERTLTDQEKEAIEFSLDFYFYDDMYYDEYYDDDFDDFDDFFDFEDEHEDFDEENDD